MSDLLEQILSMADDAGARRKQPKQSDISTRGSVSELNPEELKRYFTQQLSHWKMFDGNAEAEAKVDIAKGVLTILAKLEAAQTEREQLNEQLRKMGADWLATAINGAAESLPSARIRSLVEQHGSYRKVGELLGVDHAYLHRIVSGEKDNMSDELLRKIGLRRGTFYAAFDKEPE